MTDYTIGIDIGGTKISCALVAVQRQTLYPFKIIARARVATERRLGYSQALGKIAKLINEVKQGQALAGIGVGIPGSVDRNQRMQNGNTLMLIAKDICADIRTALNMPAIKCVADNDANCFALAEAYGLIGQGLTEEQSIPMREQIGIGLILGTGLGAGMVSQGKVWRGKDYSAFEVGHAVFKRDGRMCYCGRRGCAEQYLSGSALEASFRRRGGQQQLTAKDIFALADLCDPAAVATIHEFRQNLASLLADLANIFDPHYFVLGGGVSTQQAIYQTLADDMQRQLFCPAKPAQVFQHQHGDDAGVIGAALLPLLPQLKAWG
ncbi:MAG: ROK family protein [Pseudomonadota bacterium]|nr:ROK family protein [Pseudomonadota bacterium]